MSSACRHGSYEGPSCALCDERRLRERARERMEAFRTDSGFRDTLAAAFAAKWRAGAEAGTPTSDEQRVVEVIDTVLNYLTNDPAPLPEWCRQSGCGEITLYAPSTTTYTCRTCLAEVERGKACRTCEFGEGREGFRGHDLE